MKNGEGCGPRGRSVLRALLHPHEAEDGGVPTCRVTHDENPDGDAPFVCEGDQKRTESQTGRVWPFRTRFRISSALPRGSSSCASRTSSAIAACSAGGACPRS